MRRQPEPAAAAPTAAGGGQRLARNGCGSTRHRRLRSRRPHAPSTATLCRAPTSRQIDVQHEAKPHEVLLHVLLRGVLVQLADKDTGACGAVGAAGLVRRVAHLGRTCRQLPSDQAAQVAAASVPGQRSTAAASSRPPARAEAGPMEPLPPLPVSPPPAGGGSVLRSQPPCTAGSCCAPSRAAKSPCEEAALPAGCPE